MRSKQLGQLLLENGHAQAEHIAKALKNQEKGGGLIGQILREMGVCNEQAVALALLKQVQVTDIHCEELSVPPSVAALVPQEQCLNDKLCPFERLGNLLCVVMGNPLNRRAINALEEQSRLKVKPFKAPWPKIKKLIGRSYGEEAMAEAPSTGSVPAIEEEAPSTADLMGEEPALEPAMDLTPEPIPAMPEDSGEEEEAVDAPGSSTAIKGLDQLDEGNAEVIEADQRGLTRRMKPVRSDEDDEPPPPKPKKVAKVNVDLDTLDLEEATEVVGSEEESDDSLEEIPMAEPEEDEPEEDLLEEEEDEAEAGTPTEDEEERDALPEVDEMVAFQHIQDAFFYVDGEAPDNGDERSQELLDIILELPVAEVVAESIEAYEKNVEASRQKATIPVWSLPSPDESMLAVSLSDQEFQRMTANMELDPVGEWDWNFAAAGPIEVVEYE